MERININISGARNDWSELEKLGRKEKTWKHMAKNKFKFQNSKFKISWEEKRKAAKVCILMFATQREKFVLFGTPFTKTKIFFSFIILTDLAHLQKKNSTFF